MSEQDLEKWRGKSKPGMPIFEGPAEVRESFIGSHGIDWTASYIDPAIWIERTRTIVTRTRVAYQQINQTASKKCAAMSIRLSQPPPVVSSDKAA